MSIECNRDHMERHISLLSQSWHSDNLSAIMEIRCLRDNAPARSITFDPTDDWLRDDALSSAISLNLAGWNAYVCVNPISSLKSGSADAKSIVAAYYIYADADDFEAASRLRSASPRPDFFVRTGSKPHERLHAYWAIQDIASLDEWQRMQGALIAKFRTDPAIKDASRIMRLAGTISYPSKAKAKKGYETELTVLEELV